MDRLRPARYWRRMKKDVRTFINDCLNFVAFRGGGKVSRPFGGAIHKTEVNSCLYFDYLYIGTGVEKAQYIAPTQTNTGDKVGRRQSDGERGIRAGGNPGREQTLPVEKYTK